MGVDFTKTNHIWFFGALAFISWLISKTFFDYFPSWPNLLEGPSPFLVYLVIFFLFNKYFWRHWIFKKLGIVYFPDLNGRWKGTQRSSHIENGANVSVDAYLEVNQTFSKIWVSAYYERSSSESVVGSFSECNGQNYLFYSYDNDPTSLRTGTMQSHKGSAKLKKLPSQNKLEGCYWNSIGNYGEMNFKFHQKKLVGSFN